MLNEQLINNFCELDCSYRLILIMSLFRLQDFQIFHMTFFCFADDKCTTEKGQSDRKRYGQRSCHVVHSKIGNQKENSGDETEFGYFSG